MVREVSDGAREVKVVRRKAERVMVCCYLVTSRTLILDGFPMWRVGFNYLVSWRGLDDGRLESDVATYVVGPFVFVVSK